MFDLGAVGSVGRVTVGNRDPESIRTEEEIEEAVRTLNRRLPKEPKGRILGLEKSFTLLNIGEHQVMLQYLTYHVGFPETPDGSDDAGLAAVRRPRRPMSARLE
jgi:hypothetical protein